MLEKVSVPKLFIGIGVITIMGATIFVYNKIDKINKETLKAIYILEEQQVDPFWEIVSQFGKLISPEKEKNEQSISQ